MKIEGGICKGFVRRFQILLFDFLAFVSKMFVVATWDWKLKGGLSIFSY